MSEFIISICVYSFAVTPLLFMLSKLIGRMPINESSKRMLGYLMASIAIFGGFLIGMSWLTDEVACDMGIIICN